MNFEKVSGREYLQNNNSENYERNLQLYEGEANLVYNTDKFEYNGQDEIEYIQYNIIQEAVDTLVDMVGIEKMEIQVNNQKDFDDLRASLKLNSSIENWVRDMLLFGNSYLISVVQDDYSTSEDDKKLGVYSVSPSTVYADYDEFVPQREAKKHSTIYNRKIENIEYSLVTDYLAGVIIYSAYIQKADITEQVNVETYFPDFITENGKMDGLSFVIETELKYSNLHCLRNPAVTGHYGKSVINPAILSKQGLVNDIGNLGKVININNGLPLLQINESTEKTLKNIQAELQQSKNVVVDLPETFLGKTGTLVKNGYSWIQTHILRSFMRKKILVAGVGEPDNKYIINTTDMTGSYQFQQETRDAVFSELGISQALINTQMATGAKTGEAYKRLMQKTLSKISDIRGQIEPEIQILAYNLMNLSDNAGLSNFNQSKLPEIKWADILGEEVEEDTTKTEDPKLQENPTKIDI